MHTKVGEMLYSISAILRFLQSLTVPSTLFGFIPSGWFRSKSCYGLARCKLGGVMNTHLSDNYNRI